MKTTAMHDFQSGDSQNCTVFGCGQLSKHPNHTRPIAEVIAEVFGPKGASQIFIEPSFQSTFDKALVEGVRLCSTQGSGDLQFFCGGTVIMHLFNNSQRSHVSYYIKQQEKIKKKIRAEVGTRHLRAVRLLDASFARATEKMNTAIKESELIDARDTALVFIQQWETYEGKILEALKGKK